MFFAGQLVWLDQVLGAGKPLAPSAWQDQGPQPHPAPARAESKIAGIPTCQTRGAHEARAAAHDRRTQDHPGGGKARNEAVPEAGLDRLVAA